MTPDERDRLTRTETAQAAMDERLERIEQKVDELITAKNMGQGALWLLLKIGAAVGGIAVLWAWVADHIKP